MRRLTSNIGLDTKPIDIYEDNRSTIALIKRPGIITDRTKHIELKHYFVREAEEKGIVNVKSIASENMITDIFTKALPKDRFQHLRGFLNLKEKNDCL